MDYNEPPTLQPVALGQLAVCQPDGQVTHILAATDADGSRALDGLRALWQPLPAPDPGRDLPAEALQVTVGASMPANFQPDIHFYSPAWGRDIVDGHALSRVSVRSEAELPNALDDFLALTGGGMVGVEVADVRCLLTDTRQRVGFYHPVPVDPVNTLATRLQRYRSANCLLISVRVPDLQVADRTGFVAVSAVHTALGTTPNYLENASPARGDRARVGLFAWNGSSAN